MPPERPLARWKIVSLYAAFTAFAFFLSLYLTFPYEALAQRVLREAGGGPFSIRFGSVGPGLLGITARNVEVRSTTPPPPGTADGDEPKEPLRIKSVAVRPALFPPGLAFRVKLLGGTLSGSVGGFRSMAVRASLDDLDLSDTTLKAFSGVALAGKLDGKLVLDIPKATLPPGTGPKPPLNPDLGAADGSLSLNVADLNVNGGTLTIPMGGQPTPIDLPKIAMGDIDGKVTFQKGVGTIDKLSAKGKDVEILISGTLKLAKSLTYSEPNLELRLKTDPEFNKRLGAVAMGLSMMQPDPKDSNFRMAKITGFLGRPAFR